jgi:hypothetical protein
MKVTLGPASFEVPDGWRHQAKYVFGTPDGAGTLVAEVVQEKMTAEAAFAELRSSFLTAWKPMIIYVNDIQMTRGDGAKVPGAEGEQTALNGTGKLRFALVAMTSPAWAAGLTLQMPSSRDFLPFARRLVATASFVDAPAPAPDSDADFRFAQAAGLLLRIPRAWTGPRTLDFLDPKFDDVTLRVTVAEEPTAVGAIDWAALIADGVRVLDETDESPPPAGWDKRWTIERLGNSRGKASVRKAVVVLDSRTTVTAYAVAPEGRGASVGPAWELLRQTLRRWTGTGGGH